MPGSEPHSYSPAASPLRIALRPGRTLAAALFGLHAGALVAAFVGLSGWPLAIVSAASGLSLLRTVLEALLALPSSVTYLVVRDDGRAEWTERGGRHCLGRVGENAVVWPGMVIFNLRKEGKTRVRWLVLDAVSVAPEAWRTLRVWLLWRMPGNGPGKLLSQ